MDELAKQLKEMNGHLNQIISLLQEQNSLLRHHTGIRKLTKEERIELQKAAKDA